MEYVQVKVPGPSASSSKMSKKGWKCWAKNLISVATPANNGFAYEGEFVDVGATVELEIGSVLLRVDESEASTVGVIVKGSKGNGFNIEIPAGGSGKWASSLAPVARKLLKMSPEERIVYAAKHQLECLKSEEVKRPEVIVYYEQMAGVATGDPAAVTTQTEDPKATAMAQIHALMQQHGIKAEELTAQ